MLFWKYRGRIATDHYTFDGQKRYVQSKTPTLQPEPTECEELCHQQLGQRVVRDADDVWGKTVFLPQNRDIMICNSKAVYMDLDDTCWNCKMEA